MSDQLNALIAEVADLKVIVLELLRRVPGVVAVTVPAEAEPEVEYWPSAIRGQRIPKITGNQSVDFTIAMLGKNVPTPERDANLAEWAATHDDKVYAGKYHAGEIDDAAAGFVYAYSMSQAGTALASKLYFGSALFSGPRAVIAKLMERGERWRHGKGVGDEQIVAAYPDSQFKQDVLAVTV
jgi:hypothetical protein